MKKLKNTIKLISIIVLLLISNKLYSQTNTSPIQTVCAGSLSEPYLMNPITGGSTYQWTLSGGGTLNNGTASDNITVDWGFITGTYTITVIETDVNGCQGDPVTVDVTVISSTISTSNVTECITYSWNGQTYTASGVYTFASTNSNGCDSTATLNLTINPSTTSSTAVTECDDYNWNGQTYTASGVYTFTTTNSNGCDSVATLNLTINPSTLSSTDVTECDDYTWNGQTYTASGVYTFATTNSNGCDSIATLNLTINSFTSTPLASNQTACFGTAIPDLIATGIGSTFTWYSDISLTILVANNSPFSTGQTAAGTYTYYVTDSQNGCESSATPVTLIIYASPITGPINHW